MEPIIQPVERELLERELLPQFKLRDTNYGGNEIYVIDYKSAPSVMREIGRLREVAFRDAGGGTGAEIDIDEYDLVDDGYKQLVVWDSEDKEIVGGYRYIISRNSDTKYLSTEHYFQFSDKFRTDYLPYSIELGRSFVQPKYQRRNLKSLFALDNLWDGIGALVVNNPEVKYFFGKVTMYGDYNAEARDLLIYFLNRYFGDREGLLLPKEPINMNIDSAKMESIFTGADYKDNYKILTREVRNLNENIPPLINSYMNLSPTMKVFGTVCNREFGCVEETGILITLDDVYPKKKERHFINL